MIETYYRDALKAGQKEYRSCIARGVSPCLPVLDDFVSEQNAASKADLGVIQIPSERIVGTKTRGRVNSFAPNFMPLLDPGTEFANKWERLCESHLEEGIREPVKAYEYMNRYYVEEGNKRVSVLKFFDAPQISGRVIRILPEKNDASALYYEYVDFYSISKVNFIEFSKPGSYKLLQKLTGKPEGEAWSEEERRRLSSAWYYFRQAYDSLGGEKLASSPGDAMLAFLKVYGYPALTKGIVPEIKAKLSALWEEVTLQQEADPIDLKLAPEDKRISVIQKVISAASPSLMRVAFVHDGVPESSAWTRGHERGREYLQRVMEGQISTTAYFDALKDPSVVLEKAIRDGNTVLFAPSPRLLPASLKAAVEHPEVTIFNCALNMSHRYIRTYYARMYEVKFIVGAIAGTLAGEDPVGYLADYPIYGQIAGINAFALGARMVRPDIKVYLEWSAVGGGENALKRLSERGIRLISSQDLVRVGLEGSSSLGLSYIEDGKMRNLATPLWQWGSYYEQLLRMVQSNSEKSNYKGSSKALNYYWGLASGVVELRCSEQLSPEAVRLSDILQKSIRAGLCDPFQGPLDSQTGPVLSEGESLTPDQILKMDWLASNVVGSIPRYDELTELGKATVDMMGVGKASSGGAGV